MAEIDIEQYKKRLAALGEYTEAPTGFEFGEALREGLKRPEDMEDMIKRIAGQRARLQAIPAETRAEMPIGAFSPTQVAGLIAQRQEPVRATEETLRGVKQFREGRIEDIIERATRGYEASIKKAESKYQKAYNELRDLMEEQRWVKTQTLAERGMALQEKEVGLRYGEAGGGTWDTTARQYLEGGAEARAQIEEQLGGLTPTAKTEFYTAVNKIITQEAKELSDEEIRADIKAATDAGKTAEDIMTEISGDYTITNKERYAEVLNEMIEANQVPSGVGPLRAVGGFLGGVGRAVGRWLW